jgi:hypothetical protein
MNRWVSAGQEEEEKRLAIVHDPVPCGCQAPIRRKVGGVGTFLRLSVFIKVSVDGRCPMGVSPNHSMHYGHEMSRHPPQAL